MANKGDASHSRGIPPEHAHELRRDEAIIELHEQLRKLTKELEQVRGSAQQNPYRRGYYVIPIEIAYYSSHEGFDD